MSRMFRCAGTICYSAVTLGWVLGIFAAPLSSAENGGHPSRRRASTANTAVVHPAETDSAAKSNTPLSTTPADTADYSFGEMSIAGLTLNTLNIYGYFATRSEKNWSVPALADAQIVKESEPAAWTNPFFNVMFQHQTSQKLKWANGNKIQVIDQPETALGKKFYAAVAGKSVNQVRSQWAKLLLSGQAVAPVKCTSDKAVKKAVTANPHAVGYIATGALDDSVQEVLRLESKD